MESQTIEVTADATLPSLAYVSAANSQLGIAIANVYSDTPVSVAINVVDSEGRRIGNQVTTIPAFGHTSFPLYAKFPNLPPDFAGSVVLTGVSAPNDIFVAWTANSDSGVISSLPSGRAAMPVSQWDRVWLVFQKLVNSPAGRLLLGPDPVTLDISYDRIINAKGGNNSVVIYLALAELIDDSESELGFVVAHELGHVYQGRVQRLDFNPNLEWDADVFGLLVSTLAGYDPYAAAGALAKLAMATGQAGLITQFESQLSTDAHKSFNQRLENIYTTIQQVCSYSADTKAACQAYKNVMHPDFPSSAPLSIPRSPEREIR